MDTSKRALSRFGLGARIGEPERIGDARQWLRAQLERPQPTLAGTELGEIAVVLRDLRRAQRARDRERLMVIQRRTREIQSSELNSMLSARITISSPPATRRRSLEKWVFASWMFTVIARQDRLSLSNPNRIAIREGEFARRAVT